MTEHKPHRGIASCGAKPSPARAAPALAACLHDMRLEERGHLARELHDHFGQAITALTLSLTALLRAKHIDRRVLESKVNAMLIVCDTLTQDVRRVARSLRPGMLDKIGLVASVEREIHTFARRTAIPCEVDIAGDHRPVARGQATAVFRILQEALTNVMRHAHATRVRVRLGIDANEIRLSIRDNGRGVVLGLRKKHSLGLLGMSERAAVFGGETLVRSAPGKGTCICTRIPLVTA